MERFINPNWKHSYFAEVREALKALSLHGITAGEPELFLDRSQKHGEVFIPLPQPPTYQALTAALKRIKFALTPCAHNGTLALQIRVNP